MAPAAVDAALNQAAEFAGILSDLYESEIAAGEVGEFSPAIPDMRPAGLLEGFGFSHGWFQINQQ